MCLCTAPTGIRSLSLKFIHSCLSIELEWMDRATLAPEFRVSVWIANPPQCLVYCTRPILGQFQGLSFFQQLVSKRMCLTFRKWWKSNSGGQTLSIIEYVDYRGLSFFYNPVTEFIIYWSWHWQTCTSLKTIYMKHNYLIILSYSYCGDGIEGWICWMLSTESFYHAVERVQIMSLPGCHHFKECYFFCNQEKSCSNRVECKMWDLLIYLIIYLLIY